MNPYRNLNKNVGYSVNDCQTRYMAVNREDVEAMMIRHES
jgi:hypothetical protein